MTLFRVLSDDESKKVTRWKAPELSPGSTVVANTRQHADPQKPNDDADIRALLGSMDLKPGHLQAQSSAPRLQAGWPVDVLANGAIVQGVNTNNSSSTDEIPQVSAQLLQASYDEGYSRGYADGIAALHQQSVKELNSIVGALATAQERVGDVELEDELIALSLDIAKLVIRREINLAPEIMHSIVTAGLDQLAGNATGQRVYLHPLDANIVREQLTVDSVVHIIDESSLPRGAVRIESGSSIVNAGIEDWLNIVSAQLGLISEVDENTVEDLPLTNQDGTDVISSRTG